MTTVFLFYHPKVPKMTKKLSRYLFIIWSETILMSKSANTTKKNVREIFPISTDQYEEKGIENSKNTTFGGGWILKSKNNTFGDQILRVGGS